MEDREYIELWHKWQDGRLTHIVDTRIMKMSRSEIIGLVLFLLDVGDVDLIDDLKSLQTLLINRNR